MPNPGPIPTCNQFPRAEDHESKKNQMGQAFGTVRMLARICWSNLIESQQFHQFLPVQSPVSCMLRTHPTRMPTRSNAQASQKSSVLRLLMTVMFLGVKTLRLWFLKPKCGWQMADSCLKDGPVGIVNLSTYGSIRSATSGAEELSVTFRC